MVARRQLLAWGDVRQDLQAALRGRKEGSVSRGGRSRATATGNEDWWESGE